MRVEELSDYQIQSIGAKLVGTTNNAADTAAEVLGIDGFEDEASGDVDVEQVLVERLAEVGNVEQGPDGWVSKTEPVPDSEEEDEDDEGE